MKTPTALLAGLTAASLAATPAIAQTSRASSPGEDTSEMAGQGAWIAIAGVIAVVVLAIIAASDDDDTVSA